MSERVLLGEITGVHGIRGDVIIRSYTADPADIATYGQLETAARKPVPDIQVVRVTDRGVVARLEGVNDRTRAETFKGTQLWIPRERLPPADANEYYHADLIGLEAVTADGTALGKVFAVANFGAGDLLEIRLAGGNQTEYVPFTNAAVPEVDLVARRLVVVRPDIVEAPPELAAGLDRDDADEPAEN
jgi:16S rRNA processing protein RimM